ncbi:hypothetical protein E8E12_007615 [Didymella heteroderae]|uniref:Uncharacterized protein n=1 Tax=Didymella heteroderae TaxID=1769908 RepID=A0A9P4WUG5_9PLEO|nr:hypothetical protein E8E12_007615 [Didymella heteroderae]
MAYDNPHGLIAAAVIVQTLVLSMIVSRFASHRIKGVKLYASDYFIIAAGLLSSALAIEKIYCAANGVFAVRVAPLQKADPTAAVNFLYRARMIFGIPKLRPVVIVWIVFMALWTIGFFTAFMAICGDNGIFSARSHMNPVAVAWSSIA